MLWPTQDCFANLQTFCYASPQVLENLTLLDYHLLTKTPEAARLAGGNLLAEFLRNIKNKIEAKENGERSKRAFFYSAHDSTIMALFGTNRLRGQPGSIEKSKT